VDILLFLVKGLGIRNITQDIKLNHCITTLQLALLKSTKWKPTIQGKGEYSRKVQILLMKFGHPCLT